MLKNKPFMVLVSVTVLVSVIAGCSGDKGKEAGSTPGSAPAAPVTIDVFPAGGTTAEQLDAQWGNAVRKKFPHVTINYKHPTKEKKIEHLILGGENVDIYIETIGSFFTNVPANNLQYDLTPMIKERNVDLSHIEPSLMDSMKNNANGQIWGLPVQTTNLVLYYNKDLFDQFGVQYPKDGMTWEDIYELSRKMNRNEGGKTYAGLALSTSHHLRLNAFGVAFVDSDKAAYDNEIWKTIMGPLYLPNNNTIVNSFMEERGTSGPLGMSYKVPQSADFYDKTVAMLGTIQHHVGNPNFVKTDWNWDMVAYPTYKEKPGVGSQSYPTYFSVPAISKNKEQAFEIIQYLISREFQLELSKKGEMPVLKDEDIKKAYGSDTPFKNKNLQAAFFNQFAPIMKKTPYDNDVEKAGTKYIPDLSFSKMDVNTALRQAKEEADKAIQEKK